MHNCRCETAHPKSKCNCSCGGALHGIQNDEKGSDVVRTINIKIGGDAGQFLREHHGLMFRCYCGCGKRFPLYGPLAYPHKDGLVDKEGRSWWVHYECPRCGHAYNYRDIAYFAVRKRLFHV